MQGQDKAILVVSFGTTHEDTRKRTIDAIERRLAEAFPERRLYRGWTSRMITGKLRERGICYDTLEEAIRRMGEDGMRDILVQPTHIMSGAENDRMLERLRASAGDFEMIRVGEPLLAGEEDRIRLAGILRRIHLPQGEDGRALLLMGHGSAKKTEANRIYADMAEAFSRIRCGNAFLGTVEGTPSLEDAIGRLTEWRSGQDDPAPEVALAPLMIVAGDHAKNDMAGPGEGSWAGRLRSEGFQAVPVLKGLGEYPQVREMFVRHAAAAKRLITALLLACLLFCPWAVPAESCGAEGYDQVASDSEMARAVSIGKYGMVPVYGFDIEDGTYEVAADSSSTFFHIHKAVLTVKDGKMQAKMTLSSTSYKFLYMGTAEEAAKAELKDYIEPKDKEGRSTFIVPVEALDKEIDCAAFSKRKKKWYGRKILFDASSLPLQAVKIALPDYDRIQEALDFYDESNGTDTKADAQANAKAAEALAEMDEGTVAPARPVSVDLEDGEYSIQVHMTGGSGRASVTSPTWLIVKDGKAYAKLLWSSTYYDYMILGERKYLNETMDGGNSTFTIPITVMDEPMPVIADTTAMGHPVEIEYTLTFYGDTVADKNQVPQEAAIHVLVIALIIILAGGALNLIVKRKRKH